MKIIFVKYSISDGNLPVNLLLVNPIIRKFLRLPIFGDIYPDN